MLFFKLFLINLGMCMRSFIWQSHSYQSFNFLAKLRLCFNILSFCSHVHTYFVKCCDTHKRIVYCISQYKSKPNSRRLRWFSCTSKLLPFSSECDNGHHVLSDHRSHILHQFKIISGIQASCVSWTMWSLDIIWSSYLHL